MDSRQSIDSRHEGGLPQMPSDWVPHWSPDFTRRTHQFALRVLLLKNAPRRDGIRSLDGGALHGCAGGVHEDVGDFEGAHGSGRWGWISNRETGGGLLADRAGGTVNRPC